LAAAAALRSRKPEDENEAAWVSSNDSNVPNPADASGDPFVKRFPASEDLLLIELSTEQ
jgi:hypothetical protein